MDRDNADMIVNDEEENGLNSARTKDLMVASTNGDVDQLHQIYSTWFAMQKPDPASGMVRYDSLHLVAHKAASSGNWPCLNYLLRQGVSLDFIVGAGVCSKSVPVLEDPNAPAGVLDFTPLSSAARYAPLHIIKLLFDHGGSTDKGNLLCHAADRKDPEAISVLRYLVDRGAPTNEWYHETRPDLHCWVFACGGRSPLYLAAEAGCIENVKFLLGHGADPNKRCAPFPTIKKDGPLPIDGAILGKREGVEGKHDEIIQLLSEASKSSAPVPKSTGFWSLLGWK
ncbi:MAG: hypothetical protein Q9197_003519 [Variospora fuerteventurae]